MKLLPLALVLSVIIGVNHATVALDTNLNTAVIEKQTGLKGTVLEGGVFQVSYPRSDLHPVVAGVKMTPPMGLTAWSAFQKSGAHTMVMGDIVLTEDQVNPVMSEALNNGLEVTALHNHFFWDNPKIMFMHIGGMGDEDKLARAVGNVFAKLKETAAQKPKIPTLAIDPSKSTIDTAQIDTIMGVKGKLNKGVYKVTVGRKTTMDGIQLGNAMGVNTWAAFAGSNDQAVVDGDFAMLESELQTVLSTLRHKGINIVAIHNHMTNESPRIVFLHYWGVGPATKLAQAVRAALDTQKIAAE